jgi:hypothetical protein
MVDRNDGFVQDIKAWQELSEVHCRRGLVSGGRFLQISGKINGLLGLYIEPASGTDPSGVETLSCDRFDRKSSTGL